MEAKEDLESDLLYFTFLALLCALIMVLILDLKASGSAI
jgi:hypothetical protein